MRVSGANSKVLEKRESGECESVNKSIEAKEEDKVSENGIIVDRNVIELSESPVQESKIESKESEAKDVNYVNKSVKLEGQDLKSVKVMSFSSHKIKEVKNDETVGQEGDKTVEKHEVGAMNGLLDVNHLKEVDSSVNLDLNVLVDTSLVSYKRLALGSGNKPSIAVCRIKKMGQVENKLCDEISKLCVSKPSPKCCQNGTCESCEFENLGLMVEKCRIDVRVKKIPSMISHKSRGVGSSEFFSIFKPRNSNNVLCAEKSLDGACTRKETQAGSDKVTLNKNPNFVDKSGPVDAQKPEELKNPPVKKPNFRSSKPPTRSTPVPPKKFGRKPSRAMPAPSSLKQKLLESYFSVAGESANEKPGLVNGEVVIGQKFGEASK